MIKFIFQRLLQLLPVLLIVITVTFWMAKKAPGGPFSAERSVSPQVLAKMNAYYGLDKPLLQQYGQYLKNLVLHADLGPSFTYPTESVNQVIARSFPVSLRIGSLALLLALLIGIPLGILAAVKKNTWADYFSMSFAMGGICLPTFVMGPILAIVFGLWLNWANVFGLEKSSNAWLPPIFLPALTLGLFYGAYVARLTRSGMLEILNQDYIRTAQAKGMSGFRVIWKHALKGGMMPVVSFLGPALAGLISGSFVVEKIFKLPGLGNEFIKSAFNRDYSLILGTVIFYAVLIVLFNLIVDIIHAWLDPRIRR
ncbi:MAG TPA: ABC transporter permease subunit [Chthoniobacterales bacterium]|jgi:oligopeptide transport system permease protein